MTAAPRVPHERDPTPDDTAAALAAIPGARGGTMPGIGHFPMAENYPLFRTHLLPVLEELRAAGWAWTWQERPR